MKQRWQQLSTREQVFIGVAGAITVIALFFVLLWTPFTNKISKMQKNIKSDQKLLAWMEAKTPLITRLRKTGNSKHVDSQKPILTIIENSFKLNGITITASELSRVDKDTVQLSFKETSFNAIIRWYQAVSKKHPITAKNVSIKASDEPGVVTASFTLSKSK